MIALRLTCGYRKSGDDREWRRELASNPPPASRHPRLIRTSKMTPLSAVWLCLWRALRTCLDSVGVHSAYTTAWRRWYKRREWTGRTAGCAVSDRYINGVCWTAFSTHSVVWKTADWRCYCYWQSACYRVLWGFLQHSRLMTSLYWLQPLCVDGVPQNDSHADTVVGGGWRHGFPCPMLHDSVGCWWQEWRRVIDSDTVDLTPCRELLYKIPVKYSETTEVSYWRSGDSQTQEHEHFSSAKLEWQKRVKPTIFSKHYERQ